MHAYNRRACYGYDRDFGVDLNRNYPTYFGGPGSSDDPCSAVYRGPYAFSEPETRAVKDFLERWTNVKLGINLHAYGNFLCTPFNALSENNDEITKPKYAQARKLYGQLGRVMPAGSKIGNGMQTIGYQAAGVTSDWMLQDLGIVSVTAELGTRHEPTKAFLIQDKVYHYDLLGENYRWVK